MRPSLFLLIAALPLAAIIGIRGDSNALIKGWTTGNQLSFPDLSDEMKARLKGTGEYPPKGSAKP